MQAAPRSAPAVPSSTPPPTPAPRPECAASACEAAGPSRRNPGTSTVHPHHVVAYENGHRPRAPHQLILIPDDSPALYVDILNVAGQSARHRPPEPRRQPVHPRLEQAPRDAAVTTLSAHPRSSKPGCPPHPPMAAAAPLSSGRPSTGTRARPRSSASSTVIQPTARCPDSWSSSSRGSAWPRRTEISSVVRFLACRVPGAGVGAESAGRRVTWAARVRIEPMNRRTSSTFFGEAA